MAQAASEASTQAAASTTTFQASLDAGISPNLEASTVVGSSPNAGTSPLPIPGVPMQETIDSIGATIELAARQGIARARIELQPEELGHISIRLSQTSEGLRARVSADTPAGAQALAQGRSELRQSLSSMGLTLLQLDIGSFGHSQAQNREERSATQSGEANAARTKTTSNESEALDELDETSRPVGAPLGEIVDVLA